MSLNILITGGSGFVGSALVRKFLDNGHKVVNIDLLNMNIDDENYSFVNENILNCEKIEPYFKDIDVVIHAAAKLPLHKDKNQYIDINIHGTENIVSLSNEAEIKYFMYLSSSAIMGKQNSLIYETAIPKPFEPYGISKYKGELIIKELLEKNIIYSIVRPRTVVGDERLGIFGLLFSFFRENMPVFLLGKGNNTLQLIDKDELVEVLFRLVMKRISGEFNLGNNDRTSIFEAFSKFKNEIQSKSLIVKLPKRTTILLLTFLDKLRLSPFAPYHYKAFGESVMFESSKAYDLVDYLPKKNNVTILINSFNSYINDDPINDEASTHKKNIDLKIFKALKIFKKK